MRWALVAAVLIVGAGLTSGQARAADAKAKAKVTGTVNLNTATPAQLEAVPGIGQKAAANVVAHRQKQPFKKVDELAEVKGFGNKRLERLRPYLAVTGDSTIKVDKPAPAQGRQAPAKH